MNGDYRAVRILLQHNLLARQILLGATDSATLSTLHSLGNAQISLGEYASAEATYRELINLAEKPLATLGAKSNLGFVLNKGKKYAEAEAG